MSSRSLDLLHPELKSLALEFLKWLKVAGLNVVVSDTYRSPEEQNELFNSGKHVTNLRGGQSKHNLMMNGKPASEAFDIQIVEGSRIIDDIYDHRWEMVENIWREFNADRLRKNSKYILLWGGTFKHPRPDYPHFELQLSRSYCYELQPG